MIREALSLLLTDEFTLRLPPQEIPIAGYKGRTPAKIIYGASYKIQQNSGPKQNINRWLSINGCFQNVSISVPY